jgi:dipeptidyl aminopeptidase/acylaminoacyl peptidase
MQPRAEARNGVMGADAGMSMAELLAGLVVAVLWATPATRADKLVYYTEDVHLEVRDLNGGPAVQVPVPLAGSPTYSPRWGHDGSWITYVGQDSSLSRVCLIHPDGTGFTKLSETYGPANPSFSPDDKRIAYCQVYGTLKIVDLAQPYTPIDLGVYASYPEWSPDGNRIAYSNWANGGGYTSDIFVYDLRTGTSTQITHHVGNEAYNYPSWSPDGSMLSFQKLGSDGDWDVWRMNGDGSQQVNLTSWSSVGDNCASWNPDGQHIVFDRNDPANGWDIWTMDLNGGDAHVLVSTPGRDEYGPFIVTPEPATLALVALAALALRRRQARWRLRRRPGAKNPIEPVDADRFRSHA